MYKLAILTPDNYTIKYQDEDKKYLLAVAKYNHKDCQWWVLYQGAKVIDKLNNLPGMLREQA